MLSYPSYSSYFDTNAYNPLSYSSYSSYSSYENSLNYKQKSSNKKYGSYFVNAVRKVLLKKGANLNTGKSGTKNISSFNPQAFDLGRVLEKLK